ncbi:MAG: hypothetical protein NUW37_04905 [Planctomycetes bacterium]|nr:hypothetical protein [Planctomycetota bacterium]
MDFEKENPPPTLGMKLFRLQFWLFLFMAFIAGVVASGLVSGWIESGNISEASQANWERWVFANRGSIADFHVFANGAIVFLAVVIFAEFFGISLEVERGKSAVRKDRLLHFDVILKLCANGRTIAWIFGVLIMMSFISSRLSAPATKNESVEDTLAAAPFIDDDNFEAAKLSDPRGPRIEEELVFGFEEDVWSTMHKIVLPVCYGLSIVIASMLASSISRRYKAAIADG